VSFIIKEATPLKKKAFSWLGANKNSTEGTRKKFFSRRRSSFDGGLSPKKGAADSAQGAWQKGKIIV